MSVAIQTVSSPQLALQSYLDDLLHEAMEALEHSSSLDAFAQAVAEERERDAQRQLPVLERPTQTAIVHDTQALPPVLVEGHAASAERQAVETVVEPPLWAQEPFEALLFDVAGLTLAVPLVCLGTIHTLDEQTLTSLFGQPDWFLGLMPVQGGNLKVLDTARWVLADRYRDDYRKGLQYVISVDGYEWGLAVHQVSRSIRLDPQSVKWRTQRSQRPWLAGTVVEHMCALLDVTQLAALIVKNEYSLKPVGAGR